MSNEEQDPGVVQGSFEIEVADAEAPSIRKMMEQVGKPMHVGDRDDPRHNSDEKMDVVIGPDWGGGLYNIIFGDGRELGRGKAVCGQLLRFRDRFGAEWYTSIRYRDVWLESVEGELRLAVYTRLGTDYPDLGVSYEEQRKVLRAHPNYLFDQADDWKDPKEDAGSMLSNQNSYTTFYFSVPDEVPNMEPELAQEVIKEITEALSKDQGNDLTPHDTNKMWDEAPDAFEDERIQKRLADGFLKALSIDQDANVAGVHMINLGAENAEDRIKTILGDDRLQEILKRLPGDLTEDQRMQWINQKVNEFDAFAPEQRYAHTFGMLKTIIRDAPPLDVATAQRVVDELTEALALATHKLEKAQETAASGERLMEVMSDIVEVMSTDA